MRQGHTQKIPIFLSAMSHIKYIDAEFKCEIHFLQSLLVFEL